MPDSTKIVLIGAGSAQFGISSLRDAFCHSGLFGSELVFMDIDENNLNRIVKVAERMNKELEAGFKISSTTDLDKALPNADFVITSIAVNRNEMWKHDFRVPMKYGIRHVLGENGGPGALFHTMRNIPLMMRICKAMEQHSPNALLLNFTNPESRICLAIMKYTKINSIGLCHQVLRGISNLSEILEIPARNIEAKAFGLNHCTWFTSIRNREDGSDLYPLLRKKELSLDENYERLSRYLFHLFGLYPASGDGHLGEYFNFAWEMMSTDGYDFGKDLDQRNEINSHIDALIEGRVSLEKEFMCYGHKATMRSHSREIAFNIIDGIINNTNELLVSVNVRNNGIISNLPSDCVVEAPAIVSANGVNPLALGDLPEGIATVLRYQISLQHLVVDAAVSGDKDLAFQALLFDPHIQSAKTAEKIFEELMEVNRPYLPQFS